MDASQARQKLHKRYTVSNLAITNHERIGNPNERMIIYCKTSTRITMCFARPPPRKYYISCEPREQKHNILRGPHQYIHVVCATPTERKIHIMRNRRAENCYITQKRRRQTLSFIMFFIGDLLCFSSGAPMRPAKAMAKNNFALMLGQRFLLELHIPSCLFTVVGGLSVYCGRGYLVLWSE